MIHILVDIAFVTALFVWTEQMFEGIEQIKAWAWSVYRRLKG